MVSMEKIKAAAIQLSSGEDIGRDTPGRDARRPDRGYRISQRIRKRVEEMFGWMKTVGGFRKTRFRGLVRYGEQALMTAAAYNLIRMSLMI